MERQWHEVLLHGDDGDAAFAKATPLLIEALELVESALMVPSAVQLSHRLHELAQSTSHALATQRAVDQLRQPYALMHNHLHAVLSSFIGLQDSTATAATENTSPALEYCGGIFLPRGVHPRGLLSKQPFLNYLSFREHATRLAAISAMGLLFTACEPRLKVLRGRYALHRAYNGKREDVYHVTLGGGDVKRAPKTDVRRIETCMSAASLVQFMEYMRRSRPDYQVVKRSQTTAEAEAAGGARGQPWVAHTENKPPEVEERTTMKDIMARFFGEDVPLQEQGLSAEGLCLRPNYAEGVDRWLDLHELANASSTRATLASELLQHFLSIESDNEGELLAQLVTPLLERITSGSSHDRLELELTVTGRRSGELQRLANWVTRSKLLTNKHVQIAVRISLGAYGAGSRCSKTPDSSTSTQHHPTAVNHSGWMQAYIAEAIEQSTPRRAKPSAAAAAVDHPVEAQNYADALRNIFQPIWQTLLSPEENTTMAQLLQRLVCIAVSTDPSTADVQELPTVEEDLARYPLDGPAPSDAYLVYHVWRHTQWLNCMISAHEYFTASQAPPHPADPHSDSSEGHNNNSQDAEHAAAEMEYADVGTYSHKLDCMMGSGGGHFALPFLPTNSFFLRHRPLLPGPLRFRLHGGSSSRTSFSESVMGLLVADEITNPTTVFEWAPLSYLYYLTQRSVVITPSRSLCGGAAQKEALTHVVQTCVQTGINASIATMDPLFYDSTNDAMCEELQDLMKYYNLAAADVTEMCLRSTQSKALLALDERIKLFGFAWPRETTRDNNFSVTQVSSLRLHLRACALEHEVQLLSRKGFTAGVSLPPSPPPLAGAVIRASPTNTLSSSILLRSDDVEAAERRSRLLTFLYIPTTRAVQLERGPLLNSLSRAASRYNYYEATLQYPRIVIAGPAGGGPSAAAKEIGRAMVRRRTYRSFMVHREAADDSADAGAASKSTGEKVMSAVPAPSPLMKSPLNDFLHVPETFVLRDGVYDVVLTDDAKHSQQTTSYFAPLPTWHMYQRDVRYLQRSASRMSVEKFAKRRLDMLEGKYRLHAALTNDDTHAFTVTEEGEARGADASSALPATQPAITVATPVQTSVQPRQVPSVANPLHDGSASEHLAASARAVRHATSLRQKGDLYTCVKVDNHSHMAGGITAKTLLHFMRCKILNYPDDVVDADPATGRPVTLVTLFQRVLQRQMEQEHLHPPGSLRRRALRVEDITIAALNVQATKSTFNRFDEFNNRYNPMGISALRSLLLKTDNFMGGRYFAELIRRAFDAQAREGNTFSEQRLSIYGRDPEEWARLANWFVLHGMSHPTNRWMVQVPRLFGLYRRTGRLHNFQEMLTNIFAPLWAASVHPERHPFLNFFLTHVSAFDSVDNESDREPDDVVHVSPAEWTFARNPPFSYYMYFMWANIASLNRYRAARGLCTFEFRPHAGESGDPDHMVDAFLLADGVGHGINLAKRPALQYLFYLAQIPLAVVPLSNNALFCRYNRNPFPEFLRRGLNVSLGTDGALMFHHTEQPLIEEYSTAQKFWSLSQADISEIARYSVLMSGFPAHRKAAWLGKLYALHSVAGNAVSRSGVPMTRRCFRYEAYLEELSHLESRAAVEIPGKGVRTPAEEDLYIMDVTGYTRAEVIQRRWRGMSIDGTSAHDRAVAEKCAATPSVVVAQAHL